MVTNLIYVMSFIYLTNLDERLARKAHISLFTKVYAKKKSNIDPKISAIVILLSV